MIHRRWSWWSSCSIHLMSTQPGFLADYHLQDNSPLIDAGMPDPMFNDPDTTVNDIGAFGGPSANWKPLPLP